MTLLLTPEHIRLLTQPAHIARIRTSFALQGLAFDLIDVLPRAKWRNQRGLQLSHVLGVAGVCNWYARPQFAVVDKHVVGILMAAANNVNFSLAHFDGIALARYLNPLTSEQRDRVVSNLLSTCFYFRNIISRREYLEILMKEHDYSAVPKDIYDRLDASITALEDALAKRDRESHSLLISYPETVALLRPNEVHTLVTAAEEHTKTEIIKQSAAGKSGGAGSRKKIDISDI